EDLVGSKVLFPSVVKEDLVRYPGCGYSLLEDLVVSRVLFPFSCEGRPGGVSRVLLFPSGVKEDQPSWVL
ncbi:hypothetical protein Taro_015180, partial [Colocasia esculenta]|nr:hypothetical protein [Colocasia esculenta]